MLFLLMLSQIFTHCSNYSITCRPIGGKGHLQKSPRLVISIRGATEFPGGFIPQPLQECRALRTWFTPFHRIGVLQTEIGSLPREN